MSRLEAGRLNQLGIFIRLRDQEGTEVVVAQAKDEAAAVMIIDTLNLAFGVLDAANEKLTEMMKGATVQ